MRNDYTHITLVLDRSGSMGSIRDAAEEAFNGYIDSQRNLPGKCTVTVRQFDDRHDVVVDNKPIAECPRITLEPRGSTALLDAIGRGIHETGVVLASMFETERPATVIFVIQTDGLENASHEFDVQKINEMISHQRDVYSWDFVFLGANQDAIATAAKLGIGASACVGKRHRRGSGAKDGRQSESALRVCRRGSQRDAERIDVIALGLSRTETRLAAEKRLTARIARAFTIWSDAH